MASPHSAASSPPQQAPLLKNQVQPDSRNADAKPSATTNLLKDQDRTVKQIPIRQSSYPSLWKRLFYNSWFIEVVAIASSAIGLIAIIIILRVFSGKEPPQLRWGLTLNAIVSILSSASKSSLLCAVTATVGQLKWAWFKQDRKLQDLQAFDDAGRGPAGSVSFLFLNRPSLATLGALIIIVALAYDPFVQQVIQYPSHLHSIPSSSASTGKASAFNINVDDVNLLSSVNSGIWSDASQFDRAPSCPTGNCNWPRFSSLGWCSKCVDAAPYARLEGDCNPKTFGNLEDAACSVTFGHGTGVTFLNMSGDNFWFGEEIVWMVNFTGGYGLSFVERWSSAPSIVFDYTFLGLQAPLMTIGYVALDAGNLQEEMGIVLPTEMEELKITRAEECVLTPCTREYDVKVVDGVTSVDVASTNFGLVLFVESQNGGFLCWQPEGEKPIYSVSQLTCKNQYCSVGSNTTNYALCPVDDYPAFLQERLTGNITYYANLDGNVPDFLSASDFVTAVKTESLSAIIDNVASSLTSLALRNSSETVTGNVSTSVTYVSVQWEWLALPISLEVAGIALLVATILFSHRSTAPLWKDSLLPLLYHGLEEHTLRQQTFASDICGMERSAEETVVRLALSKEDDNLVLQEQVVAREKR